MFLCYVFCNIDWWVPESRGFDINHEVINEKSAAAVPKASPPPMEPVMTVDDMPIVEEPMKRVNVANRTYIQVGLPTE